MPSNRYEEDCPADSRLGSCLCTQEQLESPVFQRWAQRLGESSERLQRKIWEWCYISQSLHERQLLEPGRRGLGFAVGEEPLTALFASLGCEITATDLDTEAAADAGWVKTGQHASHLGMLNTRHLCTPKEFEQRVSFRHVDMNDIPSDLANSFDFLWSSCSLEHLGSLSLGEQFVYNSLACLKPGGVAVHTTEYNVTSNTDTADHRSTVIYRRRDMERISQQLSECGHSVEPFSFDTGRLPADAIVDMPPYKFDPHLKLLLRDKYVCTSVGIIVRKTGERIPVAPRSATAMTLRAYCRPMAKWASHRIKRLTRPKRVA